MFGRGYEVSLSRVRDKIRVRDGNKTLTLTVSEEAGRLVSGLNNAQKKLTEASVDAEKIQDAAEYFSMVIFGKEQADKLFDFYDGDAACVIEICGRYFRERLGAMITKAQKHETV